MSRKVSNAKFDQLSMTPWNQRKYTCKGVHADYMLLLRP